MNNSLSIRMDDFYPFPPARVWKALTEPDLIARWLMPNTFKLEVGHRFTFQTEPIPAVKFDGVAHCEVLEIVEERLLRYSWDGQGENHLRSILTWQLEPEGDGTHLYMEHAGFDPNDPFQQMSHQFMSNGWVGIMRQIAIILSVEGNEG